MFENVEGINLKLKYQVFVDVKLGWIKSQIGYESLRSNSQTILNSYLWILNHHDAMVEYFYPPLFWISRVPCFGLLSITGKYLKFHPKCQKGHYISNSDPNNLCHIRNKMSEINEYWLIQWRQRLAPNCKKHFQRSTSVYQRLSAWQLFWLFWPMKSTKFPTH